MIMLVRQFESHEIRHTYINEQFYYLANDILLALEYKEPRKIWSKLKPFIEANLGDVLQAETTASDGKKYKMSYLSLEQCFLLLQKSEQPKAIPFQIFMAKLAAEYIKRASEKVKELDVKAKKWEEFKQLKLDGVYCNPKRELDLARRLHSWMCLCGYTNMHLEHPILNILNREQRRFDFYRNTAKVIEAYEIKINKLTTEDIVNAISNRGYFEIIQNQAKPNKQPRLIFISPYKISPEVTRLVSTTNNQIKATTLKQLSEQYYMKAIKKKWKYQRDCLDNFKTDPYYTCLFNEL